MAGAKHIVSRVVLQGPAKQNPFPVNVPGQTATTFDGIIGNMSHEVGGPAALTKDAAVDQMEAIKRQLDADENLLFIEFMRRGNLDTYLEKLGAQRLRFPNAILWQIFQCCKYPIPPAEEPQSGAQANIINQCSRRVLRWHIHVNINHWDPTQRTQIYGRSARPTTVSTDPTLQIRF